MTPRLRTFATRHKVIRVASVLAFGSLAVFGWVRSSRRNPPVPVFQVQRAEFLDALQFRGEVKAMKSVTVAAPPDVGSLQIVKLVTDGAQVKEGDVVVEFDASKTKQDLDQDRSIVKSSDAQIEQSRAQAKLTEEEDTTAVLKARFAVDKDGKTIPRALVEKMNRARYFDLGMGDMRQIALSNISLRLHQSAAPADLGARTRELAARYDLLPLPAFAQQQDSFGHLNGYSAVYYTYRWSKVIADDMFTRFARAGLRDPATAADYRRKVLEPGGGKPAAELVADFLGRPISLAAYKAEMARER